MARKIAGGFGQQAVILSRGVFGEMALGTAERIRSEVDDTVRSTIRWLKGTGSTSCSSGCNIPCASPGTRIMSRNPFEVENEDSAQAWTRSTLRLAVLSLVLFYSLALASWLYSGTVVPWDSKNHFYAMFRFLGDALHNGEIPLWNPYHFGGHPAIADPQ